MKTPTLRKRVSQISFGAFGASLLVVLIGFIAFSIAKNQLATKEIERDLKRNSAQQIEQLIPSFLLPEQNDGVNLILSRLIKEEDLTQALVGRSVSDLPEPFKHCDFLATTPSSCLSLDGKETALISPITEASRTFGFLLKSKHNSSSWATQDILQLIGIMTLALGLTFAGVYFFVARLLSRTLPLSLDRLVAWIEADLVDQHSTISALPFQELESLREKISEVMDRHTRDRDQSVIGHLTSGIMHDIRTPLQSVVTAMHLTEKYPTDHPKRIQRLENLLSMCKENLPIVGRIIETTLDSSRQIQISKQNINLVETIRTAVTLNQNLCDIRKASLEIDIPPDLKVDHDPTQVTRVISNLVKNGIEAVSDTNTNPKILISIKQSSPDEVVISIDDNGAGITASSRKIFSAFRSSKIHGMGLGLHVSRKIVEAHNGTIHAGKSTALGGARFEVRLPRGPSRNSDHGLVVS